MSARNWGDTYATMLDRMLAAMVQGRERFAAALGDRQYRKMLLRMRAARKPAVIAWIWVVRSWLA
jgi:hypothetical protein